MVQHSTNIEKSRIINLRRCILETLYQFFRSHPYANLELLQLSENCGASTEEFNWNIVYLERSGFVELVAPNDCPPFVACAACISVAGIDLIENEIAFNEKFLTASTPSGS